MFRIATGRLTNHLRRAWRAPSFEVGSPHDAYPISFAYDHRVGSAAAFADTEEDSAIVVDKNVIIDGDFSTVEVEGWTVQSGTLDPDGTLDTGAIYQDHPARPDEVWSLQLDTEDITARVQNLHTGRWLGADRRWHDAQTSVYSSAGPIDVEIVFAVEPYSDCRTHEVDLRLTLSSNSEGTQTLVDIGMWPHTDFAGVFGYNYARGGLVPVVQDGDDSGFERRFLRDQNSRVLWAYLGECRRYRRYRFQWTGLPLDTIAFGELVLTQTTKIARANVPGGVAPRLDMELVNGFPQERAATPSGALFVAANGSPDGPRRASMSFMLACESELSRLRDEIFGPTAGGVHPSILVGPTAIGREVCMFGRFEDRLPQTYPGGPGVVYARVELGFQEEPFPYFARTAGVVVPEEPG